MTKRFLRRMISRSIYSGQRLSPPIIVVGMHRSGTTLLAQLLERSGVFMGIHRTKNREASFFQNINKEILDMFGCNWCCLDFLPATNKLKTNDTWPKAMIEKRMEEDFVAEYYRSKALNLFRKHTRWGWKDPRNSLLMPVWHQVFPDAIVINVVRDGRDVALSLLTRELKRGQHEGGLNDEAIRRYKEYVQLWETYIKRINESMPLFSKTYSLKYEKLLSDPLTQFEKLVSAVDLPTNKPLKNIVSVIDPTRTKRHSEKQFSWMQGQADGFSLLKELGYV